MDLRNRSKAPRPGMTWSDKWGMWFDPDTRSPEQKIRDEEIVRKLDTPEEQKRIQEKLRRAAEKFEG